MTKTMWDETDPQRLDFLRRQAQAILDNEVWVLMQEELANRYHQEWLRGQTVEARELAWGKMKGLTDFLADVKVIINAGPLPYAAPEPPTPPEGA